MKVLIAILFFVISLNAQEKLYYYYYSNNNAVSLPILTANTGTVWVGGYLALTTASDTANTLNGTQELLMNHSQMRFRQDATITSIQIYVHDVSLITSFKFKVWRKDDTHVSTAIFTLIRTSEELVTLLSSGSNTVTLTQPIRVQAGDYYSIKLVGTGNAIAEPRSVATSFNKYYSSAQSDSASKNWSTGSTVTERYFPMRFYADTAGVLTLIGNSIIDGTMNSSTVYRYNSGASHLNYADYDIGSTLGYKLGTYMNWTYQNMGVASQRSDQIQARFKTDCIDLLPRICIIEGGINDSGLANHYQLGISNRIKAMIDSCINHDIIPLVYGIAPTQQRTNAFMQTIDSVNTSVSAYCTANGVVWVDMMPTLGEFRSGGDVGNLWNLRANYINKVQGDTIHPNRNGHGVVARAFYTQALKNNYYSVDTAQTRIQHTNLTDTVWSAFPFNIICNTSAFFGVDSVVYIWNINGGTNTRNNLTMDSTGVQADYWRYLWSPDTSLYDSDDTLNYTITAYGYTDASVSNTIRVTDKTFDADYLTLYNRRTVKPTGYIAGLENDLIADLRTAGVWTGMDWFWVGATDTIANSLYDWTVNANDPTAVSSPAFVENQGYTSTSAGAYINSGFALDVDAVNFTLNSSTIACYIRTNVAENKYDMGIQSTANTVIITTFSNLFYFDVNQGGHLNIANSDSRGLWGAVRTASNLVAGYHNADSLKSGTNASTSIPAGEVYIGCRNNGSIATDFANKQYAVSFLGRGFTKTEWIAISTAINRYMTRIGSNVY